MRGLAVGQIWENKHLSDKTHDVIIRWVSDDFVWFHYLDDDYLMESSILQFLNIRKAKSVSPSLTDDQQVVLEWLKDGDNSPIAMIGTLDDDFLGIDTGSLIPTKVREGFEKLTDTQQFQVLAAFAEWGCKSNE